MIFCSGSCGDWGAVLLNFVSGGCAFDRLKVNYHGRRSCVRWSTRACRIRYALRSGCG